MILRRHIILLVFVMVSSIAAKANTDFDWTNVINAIIKVESEGNPNAKSGNSVGAMQITPILVKQCNVILAEKNSKKRYTLKDRYNVSKSKEMFLLIQEYFNPMNDVEWAIRAWNGGPRFKTKSTNSYLKKVRKAMED